MVGPLQLLKDRARLVLQRSQGHRVRGSHSLLTAPNPPFQSCPAGATMWPWLGIWDAGNVTVRAAAPLGRCEADLWQNCCDLGGPWGCLGLQTEPDWTAGHFPLDAWRLLMSAHRVSLTVGAPLYPCLSLITLADHPYLKKCPARFKFSQECGPSERLPAHLDPS